MLNQDDILKVLMNEAFARCRYELYAEIARDSGLNYYAKIFEETSRNELSHFREIIKLTDILGDTQTNLKTAIAGESEEYSSIYPKLSELAMADGSLETARLFKQIAKIEGRHQERLEELLGLLVQNSVFKREEPIKWKCKVCGYVHESTSPPKRCPGCQNGQEYYEPADFGI